MIDSNIPKIPALLVAALMALFMPQAGLGHCKANGAHSTAEHCAGEPPPGDDPVLFSVALIKGEGGMSPWVDTTTLPGCDGFTDGNLDANFPSGCSGILVDNSSTEVFPWSLGVKNTKTRMTVRLFFTTDPAFGSHPENGTVYVSDFFPAVIMPDATGFTIDVGELDENLTKLHQPDKGKVVGSFSFGSIVYTPTD